MKRFVFGVLAAATLFSAGRVSAQEKGVSFSGGADIVSTYLWRGVYEAGVSFQPTLVMTAGNFSATAWGSVDFASTTYKEMDLTLAYTLGPVTRSLADLYWTGAYTDRESVPIRPTASRWAPAGSYRRRFPSRCRGTRCSSALPT